MKEKSIRVDAKIDAAVFRRFALFDTFVRQERWRGPVLFAVLMGAFSAVCFVMGPHRRGAALLGGVLLGIGLLLPAVYFINFFLSVRRFAKGLEGGKTAYSFQFGEEGARVEQGGASLELSWPEILCAYRAPDCVYLYVGPQKAFLIPEDAESGRVWPLLERHLPPEKLHRLGRHSQ